MDNKSLNGILVNGAPVPEDGKVLQSGDVITFGRKLIPPEFQFVFEEAKEAVAPAPIDDILNTALGEHRGRIAELQRELEVEREQSQHRRQAARVASELVADLHNELACSICQDFLVHSATVECSHTFCWSCIDTWLRHKKFECPVCRTAVVREPVRSRALDTIVQKSVDQLPKAQQDEHAQRIANAEAALTKQRKLHSELEKSVNDAIKKKKAFFHIESHWSRKEKETFQRGVKEYAGATRETYCKLTGLTVQWVHSADDNKLNQALHNLQLQSFVHSPEDQIRLRLLMFLRYG